MKAHGGMPKFKAPAKVAGATKPTGIARIHPAAQARIRLPQGNTGGGDPGPVLPGVGRL